MRTFRRSRVLATAAVSATLALGAVGAVLAVHPGFSLWQSSTSDPQQVQLGSFSVTFGTYGANNTTSSEPFAPGDTLYATDSVSNPGQVPLSTITLEAAVASTDTSPTALVTSSDGLTLTVYDCQGGTWTASSITNAYGQTVNTYTTPTTSSPNGSCTGTASTLLPTTAVATLDGYATSSTSPTPQPQALAPAGTNSAAGEVCTAMAACKPGSTSTDNLLFVYNLPQSTTIPAGNYSNSDTLDLTLTGVQEIGTTVS